MIERRLTTNAQDQTAPSVSGNRVVYEDDRDGDYSIFMWDLATNTETRLTSNDGFDQRYPAISGSRVVFQDNSKGDWNIRVIDLNSSIPAAGTLGRRITADDTIDQQHPDISGNRVVYEDLRFAVQINDAEIMLYDLSTNKETRLTYGDTFPLSFPLDDDTHWHSWPVIWGDWVAYENSRDPGSLWDDVSGMNIKTKKEIRLSTGSSQAYRPAISGSRVVFHDNRLGGQELYLSDLATAVDSDGGTRITFTPADETFADISDNKVVYTYNNGNDDIYIYDIDRVEHWALTNHAADQSMPAITDNRLVWQDERSGNKDIYFGELLLPRISATAKPTTVSYGGKAKLTGTLTSVGGIPIGGVTVRLEMSPDGGAWAPYGFVTTNGSGGYSLTTPALYNARYLRANFQGTTMYPSIQSNSRRVKPKVYVRTPIAPKTMRRTKYYTVYGYLKPRHSAGSYPVRIYKWKKTSSGKWKSYGYVSAKAYNYSSYTKYLRKIRLSSSGRWRLRAYAPSDYWHAGTWSGGYDYVTVR